MMVWRLYVQDECVGTFGEGRGALTMAMYAMGDWFAAGYTSEECKVVHEEY